MTVKISIGEGRYGPKGKWAAIVRIISVNHSDGKVSGIQYQTIATRGGEHHSATHYEFQIPHAIIPIFGGFDEWWDTFNAKILV